MKKRSFKCKEILHPILERKRVLGQVLQQLWDTQASVSKGDLEAMTMKLELNTAKIKK